MEKNFYCQIQHKPTLNRPTLLRFATTESDLYKMNPDCAFNKRRSTKIRKSHNFLKGSLYYLDI